MDILCFATDQDTIDQLRDAGHNVWGPRDDREVRPPPWEADLLIVDAHARVAGPSTASGSHSQDSDTTLAITKARVPALWFMNPLEGSVKPTQPLIPGISWQLEYTSVSRIEIEDAILAIFPDLDALLKRPSRLRIASKSISLRDPPPIAALSIAKDRMGLSIGEVFRIGDGRIWCMPACISNGAFAVRFAERLEQVKQLPVPTKFELVGEQMQARLSEWAQANPKPQKPPSGRGSRAIFVSHKEADERAASALVDFLEAALDLQENDILCTSVPWTSVDWGRSTAQQIKDGLGGATVVLALLTQQASEAPWVIFELGGAWALSKLLIPILAPSVEPKDLPGPLPDLPCVLGGRRDVRARLWHAVSRIAGDLGVAERDRARADAKMERFIEELSLLKGSSAAASSSMDWQGVDWDRGFLAVDGPLEAIPTVEPEPFQKSMDEVLKRAGFKTVHGAAARLGEVYALGHRTVWLTDRATWRRRIEQGDLVLCARPLA